MRSRSASQPDLRAITFLRPSEKRFSSAIDYDFRDKGSGRSLRRNVFKTIHRRVLEQNSLLKAFSEALRSISSQLLNSYKVCHLTNVRPLFDTPKVKENKTHNSFFKELREQAPIALMGFPSLLNRQMSRSYPDFLPDHTHREGFLSLRTNVLPNLPRLVQSTPAETTRQPQEWAENIQMYALQNPESTGTGELGIPSSFCERLVKQAKPAALGQGTLLAIVGSGAGVQGCLGPDAFFQAPGRSAHLFKQTLARLCAWENGTEEVVAGGYKKGNERGRLQSHT